MLIDSNAYIGHWPFRKLEYNRPETLLERMQEFGTDVSVVSNLDAIFYKNAQPANEDLHKLLRSKRAYTNRFIPFAVINPNYAGWRQDFDVCIDRYGMKGIRLYPKYHAYDLTSLPCIELVKMSRDNGLPVMLSLRMVDKRTSSWLDLETEWSLKDIVPIVRAVPDAKFLVVNVANSTALHESDLELFKKADVMMDTSGRLLEGWPNPLLSRFGAHKFCFGTHSPILDYFTGLLRIEALKESEANEVSKELLRSGNIQRFIGI